MKAEIYEKGVLVKVFADVKKVQPVKGEKNTLFVTSEKDMDFVELGEKKQTVVFSA